MDCPKYKVPTLCLFLSGSLILALLLDKLFCAGVVHYFHYYTIVWRPHSRHKASQRKQAARRTFIAYFMTIKHSFMRPSQKYYINRRNRFGHNHHVSASMHLRWELFGRSREICSWNISGMDLFLAACKNRMNVVTILWNPLFQFSSHSVMKTLKNCYVNAFHLPNIYATEMCLETIQFMATQCLNKRPCVKKRTWEMCAQMLDVNFRLAMHIIYNTEQQLRSTNKQQNTSASINASLIPCLSCRAVDINPEKPPSRISNIVSH